MLTAVINHVNSLDKPYPISARPAHNNKKAQLFFEKNLFKKDGGSLGLSFTLDVASFGYIGKDIHQERIAGKNTFIIEDYEIPQSLP